MREKSFRRRIPIKFHDSDSEEIQQSQPTGQKETTEAAPLSGAPDEPTQAEASSPEAVTDQSSPTIEAEGEAFPEEASPAQAPVISLEDFARLEAEKNHLQERLLRLAAEFDNYRKRLDRERQEMQTQARLETIKRLLPIVDNFERALGSARQTGANDQLLAGVELIYKQFNSLLASFGVHPIETVGQRFDPVWHEAISAKPTGDVEPNTIIEEYQRGYTIDQRVLRPAKVKVAINPE
jgi:molecular chaperone GrpE